MGILKSIAVAVFSDVEPPKPETEKTTVKGFVADVVTGAIEGAVEPKKFKTGYIFDPMNPRADKHGYVFRDHRGFEYHTSNPPQSRW